MKTLIHEATHQYAGTDDDCYFRDDGLTPRGTFDDKARALNNADSFAWFALKVGRGTIWSTMFGAENGAFYNSMFNV